MNSRASRAGFRLALLSAPILLSVGLVAPTAWAAAPRPVTDLNLSLSTQDGFVYAEWTPSADTSSSNACYLPGTTAPATPTDVGVTCTGVTTDAGFSFKGVDGQAYGISVFAYNGEYSTPQSSTITAVDLPPAAPSFLSTYPQGTRELSLRWSDNTINKDTADFLVDWVAGTASPPATTTHVTKSEDFYVSSLTAGTVYTFAVRARDAAGHIGEAATLHASTRSPGIWQADNTAGQISTTSPGWNENTKTDAGSTMTANDSIRVAYVSRSGYVSTSAFAPALGWTEKYLGYRYGANHPLVAVGRPGYAVVAWSSATGAYYRFQSSGSWSAIKHPTSNKSDRVVGLSSDANNRIHLLIQRSVGTGKGLWYITNGSGTWTKQHVFGSAAADIGLLTRDLAKNRIVVVDRHRGASTETIRVAVLKPTATKVAPFTTWFSTTTRSVQWKPSSVAAYGGAVTVAVQRVSTSGSTSADGPYVFYGTATSHRVPVRVTGTSSRDSHVMVSAPNANRVVLTWQRVSGGWDPNVFGVWVSERSRLTSAGAWSFSAAQQWTKSAYDVPSGAFMDKNGHLFVLYVTGTGDVR